MFDPGLGLVTAAAGGASADVDCHEPRPRGLRLQIQPLETAGGADGQPRAGVVHEAEASVTAAVPDKSAHLNEVRLVLVGCVLVGFLSPRTVSSRGPALLAWYGWGACFVPTVTLCSLPCPRVFGEPWASRCKILDRGLALLVLSPLLTTRTEDRRASPFTHQ